MVTSSDGKVTGAFLTHAASAEAIAWYYDIHRDTVADGFICGRVTMEGSFTGGWYPDLNEYDAGQKTDFLVDDLGGFYAIAFDTNGKLGWQSNRIVDPDGDPGYDGARIVEVLSENVDERYLGYLESLKIPYLFAGKESIDVQLALSKLKILIGCDTLLLEGGSILNGAFQRADAIDELSLVMAPVIADKDDKPLATNSTLTSFTLIDTEIRGNAVHLRYRT